MIQDVIYLHSTYLPWAELSDGHSELNKCIKTAAKARSGVTPAHCDEDVLATHQVEHQDVIQLVLPRVECVSCLLVNIDLQTHILLLTWSRFVHLLFNSFEILTRHDEA